MKVMKVLKILFPVIQVVAGVALLVHTFVTKNFDSMLIGLLLIYSAAIFTVHEILGEPYPWEG